MPYPFVLIADRGDMVGLVNRLLKAHLRPADARNIPCADREGPEVTRDEVVTAIGRR